MQEYLISIDILSKTINGNNLNETFNQKIKNVSHETNIAKIKDICYGMLRHYFYISYVTSVLIKKPPKDKAIHILIKVALYELKYTKKPDYAVINDAVNLSYQLTKNPQIKKFINAVLRNFLRQQVEIDIKANSDLEVQYELPLWWINNNKKPDNAAKEILNNLKQSPKMSLRVNKRKTSQKEYINKLQEAGVTFELLDNKIVLEKAIAVDKLPGFLDGLVSIQDIHAQKLIDIVDIKPKMHVLDACSAPGGKLCQIIENYDVDIFAIDIDQKRLDRIKENIHRLELEKYIDDVSDKNNEQTLTHLMCADSSQSDWWNNKPFDLVVADVPCSASGTVKRNPDIKLHRKPSDIKHFVSTQRKIINNLWNMVKEGGQLLYITCSVFKEENEENIKFFKKTLFNIKVINELKLLPTPYADGFYYCLLQKINSNNG